jgi:hypothetical protein
MSVRVKSAIKDKPSSPERRPSRSHIARWQLSPVTGCRVSSSTAAGAGKTRVVQKFLRDNRAPFDKKLGRTRVPVVSIQMPPPPVERDLYEEILVGMGGVFVDSASVTSLRHRIRNLARQLEVRMLIIDEIHSLLAGAREQRMILNAARFLANDLRIPLVCLGTEEANQARMTDPQLADRFFAAELPAWENDAAFEQLLLSFESLRRACSGCACL